MEYKSGYHNFHRKSCGFLGRVIGGGGFGFGSGLEVLVDIMKWVYVISVFNGPRQTCFQARCYLATEQGAVYR